jgi:hypothetical protein
MTIAKELKNNEAVTILNKYLNTNESVEEIRPLSILQKTYLFLLKKADY